MCLNGLMSMKGSHRTIQEGGQARIWSLLGVLSVSSVYDGRIFLARGDTC